ncbi:phytoene desaturase family protein [Lysinibacillus sp. NPDC059133]|uniref:phytoene desaturase family protein n=1 Tax=Lysinibacillus sp. NPDC059133 TaxID=3346737 RepID=UPI0036BA3A3E
MNNSDNQYDIIVIGSGLAGLTSAALLTQSGYKVLVLEQHYFVGGLAHTFKRSNYIFDSAIHVIGGGEEGGEIYNLYNKLGLLDQIKFTRIDPMITVKIEDELFSIPGELDKFKSLLQTLFPVEQASIRNVIDEIKYIGSLKGNYNTDVLKRIIELEKTSFKEYLDEHFTHPHIKLLLSSLVLFAGVSIDELSTFKMINIMASYNGGAFYPKGNSQQLSNVLKKYILESGCKVIVNRKVEKILFNGSDVEGVVDHRGNHYKAKTIISNADIKNTFTQMMDEKLLPQSFKKQLRNLKNSYSAVVLYGVIKNKDWNQTDFSHETVYISEKNIENSRDFCFDPLNNDNVPVISFCCPSVSETSLAPKGYSIINVMSLCDSHYLEKIRDEKGKEFIVDKYLNMLEKKIPGIKERLHFYEFATPRTIHRFTLNDGGSIYGWMKNTIRIGTDMFGPETPIKGLYLTGHWSQSAHGVYGVMRSGRLTAEKIMEMSNQALSNSH